ncbi:MAG: hypothetical protein WD066_15175 [Planctomycetaceae bacterium]
MPRWLSKAISPPRAATGPPATYFVTCGCGREFEGVRGVRSWEIECPTCGEHLFLLPRDVYPPLPEPPVSRPTPRERPERAEPETPNPEPEPEVARPRPRREPPSPARRPVRETLATWVRRARGGATDRDGRARRIVTPLRGIVLATLAVATITGWWMWRQESLARAEATLRDSLERGTAALDGRDYSAAAVEYAAAARALDVLRRDDSFAADVRQTSRQLTAMENLLHVPLEEALAETRGGVAARDGSLRIPFPHAERWLVLDATVRRAADSDGTVYEIAYPLAVDGAPVSLRVRPPAFAESKIDERPSRVVFAARLASVRSGGEASPVLAVELDSRSLFLWTNAEFLAQLGFAPDERATRVLDSQARAAGVGADDSNVTE